MFLPMKRAVFVAFLCLFAMRFAGAQSCPEENPNGPSKESASRTLTGKVVYHNEIRQWFGLQLDKPVCGLTEIQLLQGGGAFEVDESNAHLIETYRGCSVTVQGALGIPGTGYYSAELYQNVDKIDPALDCVRQPAFPDYSKAKPDPSVHNYRVSMHLDYSARGGHIVFTARSRNRLLIPWQAYANYWFTGGYVLYAYCTDGFEIGSFKGTPEAKPWLPDNSIAMDPESAAEKHITQLRLDYTCHREVKRSGQTPSQ
jgi:hypothetical protein